MLDFLGDDVMDVMRIFRGDSHDISVFAISRRIRTPLNGMTICFMVKKSMIDPDSSAILSKVLVIPASPVQYDAVISLTDLETAIAHGKYFFDMQLMQDTNMVTQYLGEFIIEQRVRT